MRESSRYSNISPREDRCFNLVLASFLGRGWMNLEPRGGTDWLLTGRTCPPLNGGWRRYDVWRVKSYCMPFITVGKHAVRTSSEVVTPVCWVTLTCGWWVCLLASVFISWCALPRFYMWCYTYCIDILLSFETVLHWNVSPNLSYSTSCLVHLLLAGSEHLVRVQSTTLVKSRQ